MNHLRLHWQKKDDHFSNATCDDIPLVFCGDRGLLTARAWEAGHPEREIPFCLRHDLLKDDSSGGLLEASVELNADHIEKPTSVCIEFATSATPSPSLGQIRGHFPLTMNGLCNHAALADLGSNQLYECDQHIGAAGQNCGETVAHYLEPGGVDANEQTTRAPLLIPLVSWYEPHSPLKLALFASPERPWRFAWSGDARGRISWTLRTRVQLSPQTNLLEKCFLHIHDGEMDAAWKAFHRYAFTDSPKRIDWLDQVRVHYFDFLSPGRAEEPRGSGYDLSLPHFSAFRVGLATQHGYYSHWGDYIHPDRKEWLAMRGDIRGPTPMSLEIMRERIRATRATGAKAAIYLHAAGFDAASPLDAKLRVAARIQKEGSPVLFPWEGPDMEGKARFMSISSPEWSAHLLQQAQWIFELLNPDAVVVDETFAGIGYDFHYSRSGPISPSMIAFIKNLRALARSFGEEKAVLTSDCSLAGFALWADGEGGDHAYPVLLGHESYRALPVRYTSVLGEKPWLPCAWQFNRYWEEQMDLAKKIKAGVGLSNGWIEYTGLHCLPPARSTKIRSDIATLAVH